ncbi:GTPase family protein [Micromonospora sp. LOL_021]|uniref:GTPase family protein n=1 Tax=Micromonospora sp. LOL_021 TaxID=3345417 RepID=UPI003A8ABE67
MSVEDAEKLSQAWESELARKPPTIGVVGVSGVGKSSTINTMFRTGLPISHTVACTKEFTEVPLRVQARSGPGAGGQVRLVVIDAPGLGEDVRRDPHYLDMYERHLPECDVVLWVTAARNRAVALEQQYLQRFSALQDRIVFGISQVDLVEPRNWKPASLVPSREQEANIAAIVADRSARLSDVLGREVRMVPYSNYQGYNLEWLFTSLLESCTSGRKWIFEALKNFDLEEWIATAPGVKSEDGLPSDSRKSGGLFGRLRQRSAEQASGDGVGR